MRRHRQFRVRRGRHFGRGCDEEQENAFAATEEDMPSLGPCDSLQSEDTTIKCFGSIEIVDVEDVPLAYLPGNATRVRVKAVGELHVR